MMALGKKALLGMDFSGVPLGGAALSPKGGSKVDPVRSPDKLVPEDYWVAKVEGVDAYRGIWVML